MKAITPQHVQVIKEVLADSFNNPRDLARQIDLYCKRKGIQIAVSCQFVDNSRYEIVVPAIVRFDELRSLLAEMDLVFRPYGAVDMFVMSSSLGIKAIAKLRNKEPLMVTDPAPPTFTVESSVVGRALDTIKNWKAKLPSPDELLAQLKQQLATRNQKKLADSLTVLMKEIDELLDDQEARIDHEAKALHDDIKPKAERLKILIGKIEKLDDGEGKAALTKEVADLREYLQDRVRMPLRACAIWTHKITGLL